MPTGPYRQWSDCLRRWGSYSLRAYEDAFLLSSSASLDRAVALRRSIGCEP